jgi:tRNA(Ile)-lysidine synthase
MGGRSKKLQDFFVDKKIPRRKRDAAPLLVSENNIVWVIGLRTDERYLPRPDTKKILKVRIKTSDEGNKMQTDTDPFSRSA